MQAQFGFNWSPSHFAINTTPHRCIPVFTSLNFSFYVILFTFLLQFQQGTKKLCPSFIDQEGSQDAEMAEALPPAWSLSTVTLTVLCCYSTVPRGSSSQGEEHVLSSWLSYVLQFLPEPFVKNPSASIPTFY